MSVRLQSKSITRRIADLADNYGPMYCIWEVDSDGDLLLAGGADGLMVVDGRARTLRRAVAGVPPVFQIHLVDIFNIAVMIVGTYCVQPYEPNISITLCQSIVFVHDQSYR